MMRPVDRLVGLSSAEAARLLAAGQGNRASSAQSRTVGQILRANVATRFNAILGVLLIVIVVVGPAKDGLFGVILVTNTLIGVVQELRAKRTLDRLSLLNEAKVAVVRDGDEVVVSPSEVVRGDLVGLRPGGQVVADGPLEAADGLEVDESLLTGEAEPQVKAVGDQVRSGSFVTAGMGWFVAEKVGDRSYANVLAAEARTFAPATSELREATDTVLRVVSWAMGPIAGALLIGQRLGGEPWKSALAGTVSGVVGMVPEGLVLLTSMTLAMSVVRLGRVGVLVQELGAVEGLARVDTICFDKTGTLTEGHPVVEEIIVLDDAPLPQLQGALLALTADSANPTALAIQEAILPGCADRAKMEIGRLIPFSSARKWAAVIADRSGPNLSLCRSAPLTWVLGAPEIVLGDNNLDQNRPVLDEVATRSATGRRVLIVARTAMKMPATGLPGDLRAVGLITLTEKIRPDAPAALAYFAKQGVDLKVISGDNPETVAAFARRAGITGLDASDAVVDARTLRDDQMLSQSIVSAHVIGRTMPQQKRAMVAALQAHGRTVAMTGDGVNDALALKVADLGIAMGSGSAATRAVAQLVLVNGDFACVPGVVAEGRRVIANVERVAKLFLTKTVYAAALAVASGVARLPFPFLPRHLTLVSALTIGIPGFFLAFEADAPQARQGFLKRVAAFTVPAGLVAAAATFVAYATALLEHSVSVTEARTTATFVLGLIGLWIVSILGRPLSPWRVAILGAMVALGVAASVVGPVKRFYDLNFPPPIVLAGAAAIAAAAISVIELGWRLLAVRTNEADR